MESNIYLINTSHLPKVLLQLLLPNISKSMNALLEKETLNLWFSSKNTLVVIMLKSSLSLGLLIPGNPDYLPRN